MFYGRKKELALLKDKYLTKKGEFIIIYGRRRVGKSSLVHQFAKDKPYFLKFEGIEGGSTGEQIQSFKQVLSSYIEDKYFHQIQFANWQELLSYFSEKIISNKNNKEKIILFLDEIQWMAAGRSKFISLIKYFWDNHWKDSNVMLILCGSIASFMVKKVIHSNALYGRITLEILLKGLKPDEVSLFFKQKRSKEEILQYMFIFGGIPRYFEEININRSLNQNVNMLCFSENGFMINEISRIFYSQFKDAQVYSNIVMLLHDSILSLNEISIMLQRKSGGSLKQLIDHLISAELVEYYIPIDKGWKTKIRKFRLSDEFLIFYFKYIEPNLQIINSGNQSKLFEKLTGDSFNVWLGFAFERFCLKHSDYLARKFGFHDDVLLASPYFGKKDSRFQIDLLYKRVDKVIVLCEIKYHNKPIGTKIIPEIEKKCEQLPVPRGYTLEKALISLYGPDKGLADSEYFNYHLTIDDIIS